MSQFLPSTAEAAVRDLLDQQLADVDVKSIGGQDVNEKGELVFRPPCVRTRYAGTQYAETHDAQALTYNAEHIVECFCIAENLRSKEAQREDTKALADQVLEQLAGARLKLSDGSKSEPCRLIDAKPLQDDLMGMVYTVSVAVPGIAQFDGINANPNS